MTNRPFFRQHEPLPTPDKWDDSERRFAHKLEQLLDELFQLGTKLRLLLRGEKVGDYGLSQNSYTDAEKEKLENIETLAVPVPIEKGGTGQTSVAAARNAFGLGNTDGPLPIANGGTGASTAAEARNNLGLGNTDGALPVANGGTGAATVAAARNNLGLGNTDGALPVANGGTGASNAASARTNLGLVTSASKSVVYNGITIYYWTYGNVVTLAANSGTATAAKAANVAIGTLPSAIRPLFAINMVNTAIPDKVERWIIQANGNILCQSATTAGEYIRFHATYVCVNS